MQNSIYFSKSMRKNFLNAWTGWYRFSSYKKSVVELKSVGKQTITKKSKKLNDLLLNMPKDNKHVIEAQKQRLKIKAKSTKYPPGIINIQILGNGSKGSPAVVYLFSDQSRYLINCGEGCQRLAHEHKLKLARLENIFLTRTTWDKTGGMPGLCLTVQEAGVPNLTLYGPPGIQEIFDATRRFVVLKDLKVNVPECNDSDYYDDNVMRMHFVHLYRDPVDSASVANAEEIHVQKELLKDSTDYYSYEGKSAKNSENSDSSAMWDNNNDDERRQEEYVLSYICKLKPRPGQLDLAKCVERGVKPGPMLGQLKNGMDVTLDDGTVVCAEDVCGPSDPGPVCIFVDIPNENFLNSLKSTTRFNDYQKTATNDSDSAMCVIHFSPKNIVEHPIYQEFMEKFSLSTKHFMLNEQNDFSGYVATHRIQWQLNQLDDQVFPVLKEANDILSCDEDIEESLAKKIKMDEGIENLKPVVEDADKVGPLTAFHLRPKKGLDLSIVPEVNPKAFIDETTELEGFREILDETQQQKRELLVDRSNRCNDYPKIVFLGTGSCIPNKTRNVSSILIHINKSSSIIFDCGEGTYGQIYRFYGKHEIDNVLKRIKAIFVSHLHADHHLGLIGLLKRRSLLTNEKIQLYAPHQIYSWLYFYDLHIERINHLYDLVGNVELLNGHKNLQQIKEIGLSNIQTCFVRHCPHAFAVSIEMNNNTVSSIFKEEMVKITYSGDTIPCRNLVELGRNSTILIHEATMEDNMQDEAKFKMHSTISQAINQGKEMNAQYTILTHFSQRYAKIPRIENAIDQNVAIAFDNMEVTLNDLPLLHLFYPSLKVMFQEHCLEMEEKALKRQYKKERIPKQDKIDKKNESVN